MFLGIGSYIGVLPMLLKGTAVGNPYTLGIAYRLLKQCLTTNVLVKRIRINNENSEIRGKQKTNCLV